MNDPSIERHIAGPNVLFADAQFLGDAQVDRLHRS
jgi:hypothetical protein